MPVQHRRGSAKLLRQEVGEGGRAVRRVGLPEIEPDRGGGGSTGRGGGGDGLRREAVDRGPAPVGGAPPRPDDEIPEDLREALAKLRDEKPVA
jgi:hypothetical protein